MFYSLNASSRSLNPTSLHAFALCKLHKYQPPHMPPAVIHSQVVCAISLLSCRTHSLSPKPLMSAVHSCKDIGMPCMCI